MSFKEVTELRKAGRLDEALRLAKQDLQKEKSEWTYGALFWVYRDFCKEYLSQDRTDDALTMLQQMENIVGRMDDDDGFAQNAISYLRRQLTPCWDEVSNLTELSKNGHEEQAYDDICDLHRVQPLSDNLHEAFGWIIYRYLKKCYQSCGSLNARKALHAYLQLNNERPSLLHSQMLNIATSVSEQYDDFKFLPFLELWDVNTLSDEDFLSSIWNEKELPPLTERIIERCFRLGYGLEETKAAFTKNERISDDLVESLFSKIQFFIIYKSKSEGDKVFFANVERYVSVIDGLSVSNDYHSRILSLYLWSISDEDIADAIPVIDKWGLGNLRNEDWQSETDDDGKEFPPLVEMVVKKYFAGLKAIRFCSINEQFEELLRKACRKYDDDQLDRNLALLLMAKGNREEALSVYRSLLLTLNQYYVWKELAELTDDAELKVSAYCKAILVQPVDDYLGDVHLGLAKVLINSKLYGEAKRELQTYADTYNKKNWRIRGDYYTLLSQIPNGIVAVESNTSFYQSHLSSAEEFVYADIEWTTMIVADVYVHKWKKVKRANLVSVNGISISINLDKLRVSQNENVIGRCFDAKIHSDKGKNEIVLIKKADHPQALHRFPSKIAVVDHVNEAKALFHCVFGRHDDIVIKYSQTSLRPQVGDYLSVFYYVKTNKEGRKYRRILDVKKVDGSEKKLTSTATGKIRIRYNYEGHPFGFVEDYYVPGALLDGIDDGDRVTVNVVFDGERWKAYSVEKANVED